MSTKITSISNEIEIAKVIAFARAGVRGKQFRLAEELVEPTLEHLERWARENDVRVQVRVVNPNGVTVLTLGSAGAAAGAIAGFLLTGNPAGVLAGAVIGASAGVIAAHLAVTIHMDPCGGAALVLA